MVSFPQVSPQKPCAHLSLPPYVPHALPISFFSILSISSLLFNIFEKNKKWTLLGEAFYIRAEQWFPTWGRLTPRDTNQDIYEYAKKLNNGEKKRHIRKQLQFTVTKYKFETTATILITNILLIWNVHFMEIGCRGVHKWRKVGNHWCRLIRCAYAWHEGIWRSWGTAVFIPIFGTRWG